MLGIVVRSGVAAALGAAGIGTVVVDGRLVRLCRYRNRIWAATHSIPRAALPALEGAEPRTFLLGTMIVPAILCLTELFGTVVDAVPIR